MGVGLSGEEGFGVSEKLEELEELALGGRVFISDRQGPGKDREATAKPVPTISPLLVIVSIERVEVFSSSLASCAVLKGVIKALSSVGSGLPH